MKKIFSLLIIFVLFSCEKDEYLDLKQEEQMFSKNSEISAEQDKKLLKRLLNLTDGVGKSFYMLPMNDDYANIPQDPLNPITLDKVRLGQRLFHETATGGNPKTESNLFTYSCASCHHAAAGFSAGIRQGIGEAGVGFGMNGNARVFNPSIPVDSVDIQPLRSPTVLNVAYQDAMLWNGQFGGAETNAGTEANWTNIPENALGFHGVEVQAIKGQGVHRLKIDEDFIRKFNYKALFKKAYPTLPDSERFTAEKGAMAIAAYERTILPFKSPWQNWLRGDSEALSIEEKRGARVFFGNGKCYKCHSGPALNDKKFHAYGMGDFDDTTQARILNSGGFDSVKKGRGGFTQNPDDDYKFKTPTLYNLVDNGFFGHGGTFTSVRDVIEYKINGVPQNTEVPEENLASLFGGISLTENQIDYLVLFIENGLRDPKLERYLPSRSPTGNCIPNGDIQSQMDLGCIPDNNNDDDNNGTGGYGN